MTSQKRKDGVPLEFRNRPVNMLCGVDVWLWQQKLQDTRHVLRNKTVGDIDKMSDEELEQCGLSPLQVKRIQIALGRIRTQEEAVSQWLFRAGFGSLSRAFAEHQIDLDSLLLLDESDLKEIGVSDPRVRALLLRAIRAERRVAGLPTPEMNASSDNDNSLIPPNPSQLELVGGGGALAAASKQQIAADRLATELVELRRALQIEAARSAGLEAALEAAVASFSILKHSNGRGNSNKPLKAVTRDVGVGADLDLISGAEKAAAKKEVENLLQMLKTLREEGAEHQIQSEVTVSKLKTELTQAELKLEQKNSQISDLRERLVSLERAVESEKQSRDLAVRQLNNTRLRLSIIEDQLVMSDHKQ